MRRMEHLKNFLQGLSQGITLFPEPRRYQISGGGFAADSARLRNSFAAVGRDMQTVINRDQQANYRTR
jgi:hypothetical protein